MKFYLFFIFNHVSFQKILLHTNCTKNVYSLTCNWHDVDMLYMVKERNFISTSAFVLILLFVLISEK